MQTIRACGNCEHFRRPQMDLYADWGDCALHNVFNKKERQIACSDFVVGSRPNKHYNKGSMADDCNHEDRTTAKYHGGHVDVMLCLSCGYLVAELGGVKLERQVYETGPVEAFLIDKIFELVSRSGEWRKVP